MEDNKDVDQEVDQKEEEQKNLSAKDRAIAKDLNNLGGGEEKEQNVDANKIQKVSAHHEDGGLHPVRPSGCKVL